MKVKTLFISDTHIGSDFCNHEKILKLLGDIECDQLFIVGDFIDGWVLKSKFKWHKNYNVILQKILRMSRKGVKVYYLFGNHDDFMESFDGVCFGENILIARKLDYETVDGRRFLILHGDQFDGVICESKFIQLIGSHIYEISLRLNKLFRFIKFSFSNFLKQKAKDAVKYISNYEEAVSDYCKSNNYDGVICGHIHRPEIKQINGVTYINTGDFIESNSYLVENLDGKMEIRYL